MLTIKTIGNTTVENIKLDGGPLMSLIRKTHDVKTGDTLGNQIICMDGVCAKGDFWWKTYINNKIALIRISDYVPKEGDNILIEYGDTK